MKKFFLFLFLLNLTAYLFSQSSSLLISKVSTSPKIDGLGSDNVWLAQPSNPVEKSIGKTNNFSGFFKMCYDDNNLYVLVSVKDSTANNNGSTTWQSDCVELYFAMDISNSSAYRTGDCSIRKLASRSQISGGVEVMNNTSLSSNANFIVQQTYGPSYVQEWQIPIKDLVATANYNKKSFRFDIQLSDNDGTGNERTGQLFWNSNADDQYTRVLNQGTIELKETFSGMIELIAPGSSWSYFKGTANPPSGWNSSTFNNSSWSTGITPFRYGDGTGGTLISDMQNNYLTYYLIKKFQISTADSLLESFIMNISYDDGFRMYINGLKVLERNAPATDDYNSAATAIVDNYGLETVQLSAADANIKSGDNTIAIVVYNANLGSSDLYFDLNASLVKAEPPLPKAPEVVFSHPGGYYTSAFDLQLSTLNTGDSIYYTIDCSDPGSSSTKKMGVSPFKVTINPDKMFGRPNTPAVVIRATVIKSGFSTRNSETRSYIYLNKIKNQTYPGTPWPSINVNGQVLEYDVDSVMAFGAKYNSLFETAMKSIATVSLVTTNDNLFNAASGIYVNAMEHGDTWERPASLELIETDNSQKFATNIGLRIRGGWSRHDNFAKHAFRIFYKDKYGKKKLDYPLFGSEGADEFDKFDLRCAQNYSWSQYYDVNMTFAQDEFCRDVQGLMNQPYTRSKYCHLFLNGLYWGLFEFQERPEANFGATYKGGKKDNYDVIKVDVGGTNEIEATDGDLDMYQNLLNITKLGFKNNDNYYKIQGLKPSGTIDTTINALLDIDNMIDYMLNIFYSGNFDSPLSAYKSNNGANNYYAIKNKKHKRQGFFFVVHDAEHTFNWMGNEASRGGVQEDRVNLEKYGMQTTSLSLYNFTTHQMHYKLKENDEYRMRFADRAYKELYNNGLFTSKIAGANFRKRANQIDMAIIGESVRWGHNYLTRDDDWIPAVNNLVTKFINLRTPIVIQQLKDAKLLPNTVPPTVYVNDNQLTSGEVFLVGTAAVKLVNPQNSGTILYTLDGSDPRLPGGGINPNALVLSSGSSFDVSYPLKLKIRTKDTAEWSPMRQILFTNTDNRENIRITEIQYNPKDLIAAKSKDMEFIEFKNIGDKGIDLGGCRIDSAVEFTFPKGTIVNPNGFVVVASDKNDFEYTYWVAPTGVFKGNLSNRGEQIVLFDESNNKLIDVKYDTTYPWPLKPNGSGYSLVSRYANPDRTESESTYWKSSIAMYGSPFSDDSTYVAPNAINTEHVFCEIYPNPVAEDLYIKISENNPLQVKITDLSGRVIQHAYYSKHNGIVDVNFRKLKLNSGLYLVNIQSGNKQWQKKVVYQE